MLFMLFGSKKKANGKFKVFYRKKTGSSWADPITLADDITCSSYQSRGPQAVITSIESGTSYKLMVVWVDIQGLVWKKLNSTGTIVAQGNLPQGTPASDIWYPSIIGKDDWLCLSCDLRNSGNVYSLTYDETNGWSSVSSKIDHLNTYYDRYSQIAITPNDSLYAVWYARPTYSTPYQVYFRKGYKNNVWIDQQEQVSTESEAKIPSVTYFQDTQGPLIAYETSDKKVKVKYWHSASQQWVEHTSINDSRFANLTHTTSQDPVVICTQDQSNPDDKFYIGVDEISIGSGKASGSSPLAYYRQGIFENHDDKPNAQNRGNAVTEKPQETRNGYRLKTEKI